MKQPVGEFPLPTIRIDLGGLKRPDVLALLVPTAAKKELELILNGRLSYLFLHHASPLHPSNHIVLSVWTMTMS